MAKATLYFIALSLLSAFLSCSSTKNVSVLYSDNYDKNKDQTSINIFPYGLISIPGKWVNTRHSDVSDQYFFKNADSMIFAVAMQQIDGFEFYKKGMTTTAFLAAYYEWDAPYLKKIYNGEIKKIKEDITKNFIIWQLALPTKTYYILMGIKNKTAYNLLIETDKWEEAKKVEMLETAYTSSSK